MAAAPHHRAQSAPLPAHLAWLIRPPGVPPASAGAHPGDAAVGADEQAGEDGGGADVTGAYAWPAGSRLAEELAQLVDCRGATVADLGCGLGQLGFSALALDAAQVRFADGARALVELAARTISCNQLGARAQASVHQWGDPLPGAPFTLILGGDILYRPECFSGLAATLDASLAPGGECLLADPRRTLDPEFTTALAHHALAWIWERRAAGYTLARVRRARA